MGATALLSLPIFVWIGRRHQNSARFSIPTKLLALSLFTSPLAADYIHPPLAHPIDAPLPQTTASDEVVGIYGNILYPQDREQLQQKKLSEWMEVYSSTPFPLSPEELNEISLYTLERFPVRTLRHYFAEQVHDAFAKGLPLKSALEKGKQATVYRGYSAPNLDAFSSLYIQDEIIRFPAFTSASFSQAGAFGGNVLFIMRALSARAIWWLSPNFHEEEALIPTDRHFQVVDKEFQSVGNEHSKLVIVLQETTERT